LAMQREESTKVAKSMNCDNRNHWLAVHCKVALVFAPNSSLLRPRSDVHVFILIHM
jgi:hypothetical protein